MHRVLYASMLLLMIATLSAKAAPHVPGQLLIQLEPGDGHWPTLTADFANVELQPERLLSAHLGIWLCRFDPGRESDLHLLRAVRNHGVVQEAQFNHYIKTRETYPDDPHFEEQWSLENTGQEGGLVGADVDAPEAWDGVTGGLTAWGDTIVIAIIDEGFSLEHEDLRFWKNYAEIPDNGEDDDDNGYIDDFHGWDAYQSDGTLPVVSHGTHVAGIASARGNNGIGIAGVDWGAQTLPPVVRHLRFPRGPRHSQHRGYGQSRLGHRCGG